MPDIHCAKPLWRPALPSNGCAMISCSPGRRVEFFVVSREARRGTQMMAADRSTRSYRAILCLFVLFGIPAVADSANLEDSAKELARKIAKALPIQESVSFEIRNLSSLRTEDVTRVEQALKAELQDRGIRISSSGSTISVVVTLSENFENFVWAGEIHQGDTSQVVLVVVERPLNDFNFSNALPITIRGEKFWEGPERILDAEETSDGAGKSWLVLLLPEGLRIRDIQNGSVSTVDIASAQSASRDPWGNLGLGQAGNTIVFSLTPRVCSVNLETHSLTECIPREGAATGIPANSFPVMFDIAPPGPPPAGKGTVIELKSACGGANQFLATGARDYTQTDSLQVFQRESSGAVAVSAEVDFPGPITALHAVSGTPRAVVRNLKTGNYEAYRLSFSCVQ